MDRQTPENATQAPPNARAQTQGQTEAQTQLQPPAATTLDVNDIMAILPHRYPFLLIDRVVEVARMQRIVALKNVTINEPFFQGHFPGYPIMPGVLMVEAIAQAGGALLLTEVPDRADKLMVFTGIERAKFRRPVVPGDQLRIEVEVLNWKTRAVRMQGNVFVEGKLVCEAVVMCQLVPRTKKEDGVAQPENAPQLAGVTTE
jgi:3-hydroxyacyl-[acyl-carrier-protein] dehydratase